MVAWKARRPAPASAVSEPPESVQLGGEHIEATSPQDEIQTLPAADSRLIGVGLSPSDAALLDCLPVVMHPPTYARLFGLGVHGPALTGGSPFAALHVEPVCFLPGDHFEFARDLRDQTGSALAVIIPCRNKFGETDDLAAWDLETNAIATWRGAAAVLGEDNLDAPQLEIDGVRVFDGPADWLRSGRRGVVVLDSAHARWRLSGISLVAGHSGDAMAEAFGGRLREMLRLPEPRIFLEVSWRASE